MVAVPTPLDWVGSAGSFASAAMLKAGVEDPLRFLLDPPRCRLRQIVAQSIPNATFTSLTFTSEVYDNEATAAHLSGTGMHDNVTNNTRITIRTAGTYRLTGGVGFAVHASNRRGTRYLLNGGIIDASQSVWPGGYAGGGFAAAARTLDIACSAGDYLELQAYQDSGGALNTDATAAAGSDFAVRWIGP